jgi:dihydrofolate synthase/folylpolyglutamate synthase
MAFDYFAAQSVDIAIIETGLGGRLDSTNIILPELSIITNIGMDHMNLLGNTLTAIAGEKAGIIKPLIPVVIGEYLPETLPVFLSAAKTSHISLAQEKRYISDWLFQDNLLNITVVDKEKNEYQHFALDLTGFYQTKNLLTVLEACTLLQQHGWNIHHSHIQEALKNVKKLTGLHGRWEVIQMNPMVILDVGHNVDGIKAILTQLDLMNFNQLHWVMGMVKDKDIHAVLSLLPITAKYYFTKANIPRALDENELLNQANEIGLTGTVYSNVNDAIDAANENAGLNDLILVCGSVFLIAEVQRN